MFLFFFFFPVQSRGNDSLTPAPDSAVNHGSHPSYSHMQKHKHKPGDSLQLEAGPVVAVDLASYVWLAGHVSLPPVKRRRGASTEQVL